MISAKHVNELLNFSAPGAAVATAYVEVEGAQATLAGYQRALRGLTRSPDEHPAAQDLRRIERFLAAEFEPGPLRGAVVVSCAEAGLWRVLPLPQPVRHRVVVDSKPYMPPLLSLVDQYHRFGVLLADGARARFLEVFMGQVREHAEMTVERGAVLRPEAGDLHPYLKAVADKLDGLARNQGHQRLIVGASPEVSLPLVNHLHSFLQQNLILDPELGPDLDCEQVLERVSACESQARQVRERVLVQRLLDATVGNRLAVVGLERVMAALQNGQVRTLFVRDGYAKMGRVCPGCRGLTLDHPKCLDCRRPTEAVFNVVGELMDRAWDMSCEVIRLLHETPLDNVGRIGAELSHQGLETPLPSPSKAAA